MRKLLLLGIALLAAHATFGAQSPASQGGVPLVVPALDRAAIAAEDRAREAAGLAPRFAIPFQVDVDPADAGAWRPNADGTMTWRLDVEAPGAVSINLGFRRFHLPDDAALVVYPTQPDGVAGTTAIAGPFTAADNALHGELWTPILWGDAVTVELSLPLDQVRDLRLTLSQVGSGYRGFGAPLRDGAKDAGGGAESGSCNFDVVCPEGAGWKDEISAVGVISTGGSTFCTGFMVNNTANDKTPYFMTANHCGINAGNAASLVVYWNFEKSTCGGTPDGQLTDYQTGSYFRASYSTSDFTLVELDSAPDPAWDVTFAGWDRTGNEATTAIGIHHPNTDEKAISFEFQPTTTTDYLGTSIPGNGSHVRITDWDLGTTEPGSSGSPLFDQAHHVIGQLHGGYAACGNDLSDWYGRFSRSWTGGGTATTRLSDWLDPLGTGALSLDTLGVELAVSPVGAVVHEGGITGPFTQPSTVYTLQNKTLLSLDFKVSLQAASGLIALDGGSAPITGSLAPGATAQVTASVTGAVATLGVGEYSEVIRVDDLTHGQTVLVAHGFVIGKQLAFDFPMDTDPGWQSHGAWAFGQPLGLGGAAHGNPDPTSGATGANVLGYNLAGDYTDNLPAVEIKSTALDCSHLFNTTVSFQRWLNVESPSYDHAKFWVSDGVTKQVIWENGGEITDNAWVPMSFDVSSVADGKPTVYLGWTMGTTDSSYVFSGWNVDDVQIEGVGAFTPYGAGCAGTGGLVPALDGGGDPTPGGMVSIQATDALPGGVGLLALSTGPTKLAIAGCDLLIKDFVGAPIVLSFDGAGAATLPATLPATTLPGMAVFLQLASLDPGAANGVWALSNGLELLIQ